MFVNVTVCRSVCSSTVFLPLIFLQFQGVSGSTKRSKNRSRRLPRRVLSLVPVISLLLSSYTLKHVASPPLRFEYEMSVRARLILLASRKIIHRRESTFLTPSRILTVFRFRISLLKRFWIPPLHLYYVLQRRNSAIILQLTFIQCRWNIVTVKSYKFDIKLFNISPFKLFEIQYLQE